MWTCKELTPLRYGALLGEEGLWHQAERAWGGRGGNGLHECERGGQTLGTARRKRCGISGGAPALSKRTSNVECLDVTPISTYCSAVAHVLNSMLSKAGSNCASFICEDRSIGPGFIRPGATIDPLFQ